MSVKITGNKYEENNILGTDENEVIKGGNVNDTIEGGLGADTITGGAGKNTIKYATGGGNDVINLTKGENFTLELTNVSDINNVKFEIVKKDLRIYTNSNNPEEYITLKNFAGKDITNNGNTKKGITDTSSVELLLKGSNTPINLREMNIIDDFPIYYREVEKNHTGSWLPEGINAINYKKYDKNGILIEDSSQKGLSLNGKDGFNMITGSNYSDTIKGGKDIDSIQGGLGNDKITAGAGKNTILYEKGDGNDIITLTKGENLTLSLTNISSLEDITFEFVKKDLRIYTSENEYITLKNFVGKDVTNNGNAKMGIDDTSSVELLLEGSEKPINLKEYLFNVDVQKNYTGSWLNEEINATDYKLYVDNAKTEVNTDVTKKGLTLNSKDGDDVIIGSNYSDVIKGGNGDDTITSGTGNDKLYGEAGKNTFVFNVGDGSDTIFAGKGEDTIAFNKNIMDIAFAQVHNEKNGKGTKDLIIIYGDTNGKKDTLIIKNYFAIDKNGTPTGVSSSVKYITTTEGTFSLENVFFGKEKNFYIGTNSVDTITTTDNNDTVIAYDGNDVIELKGGNDLLVFDKGNGNDIIKNGTGSDTIKFVAKENLIFKQDMSNGNLVIEYGNNDSITLENYFNNATNSVSTIINGNDTVSLVEEMAKGLIIYDTANDDEINGGNGNDIINITGGNDTIELGSGSDKIKFAEEKTLTFVKSLSNEDLVIKYGDADSVTLKDYFAGTHSVSSIINGDKTITIADELKNGVVIVDKAGDNEIVGTDGNDIIQLVGGNDIIELGSGSDKIKFEDEKTLTFVKSLSNEDLVIKYGDADSVTLKDYFAGTHSVSSIINGDKTIIIADELKNGVVIVDKAGDNEIVGTDGNDIIQLVGGNDTIELGSGSDKIKFDTEKTLTFIKSLSNEDLVIKYGDADSVTLKDYFAGTHSVSSIINGDKTINIADELKNGVIIVDKAGDNEIHGTDGNDIIQLVGGNDTIEKTLGSDKIKFDTEKTFTFIKDLSNNDLVIKYGDTDSVTLKDYFAGTHSVSSIINGDKTITIADEIEKGLIIYDTTSGNEINGTLGDDNINISGGNDTISNSLGADTINLETTEEFNYSKNANSNDLVIKYGDTDSIILKDYFVNNSHSVSTIINGSDTITVADEVNKGIAILGTNNNDDVIGTVGNDSITAEAGDDVINAGKGNDTINGGYGSDTYVFANGDGADTVINGTDGKTDTIKFTSSTVDDLSYSINGNDLVISYNNDTDTVTIKDYFTDGNTVTDIIDSNGDNYKIADVSKNIVPTNDVIVGTKLNDVITLTTGDHTVTGGLGNDTITLGVGNDNVAGNEGNDVINMGTGEATLVFNNGDGNDTIYMNDLDSVEDKLQFTNTDFADLKFELNGNDVIIWHEKDANGDYQASVTIKDWANYYDPATDKIPVLNKIYGADGETQDNENIISKIQNTIDNSTLGQTTIQGTNFADIITTATNVAETINAGAGDDTINGSYHTSGIEKVYGEAGNDYIAYDAYSSQVYIDGGEGNDTLKLYNGTAIGGLGADSISVGTNSAGVTIYGDLVDDDIQGDNDTIYGGNGSGSIVNKDTIYAGGGDDKIICDGGSDLVYAGSGNDTIYSYREAVYRPTESRTAEIHGGDGNDVIYAHKKYNNISGDAGDDIIYAHQVQTTTIDDSEGNDTLYVTNISSESADAKHSNLNILFNVANDYKAEDGINFGDIAIVNDSQISTWISGGNYTGITIKDNAVETIISYDNYSITSEEIAQLAESVATWLTANGRDYADVAEALASDEKDALLEFITAQTNWTEITTT